MGQNEFWRTRTPGYVRGFVYAGGVVCAFTGLATILALGFVGLFDCILMLGLAYGIMMRRSRVCAVVAGAYYAVNQLLLRLLPLGIVADAASMVMVYVFIGLLVLSIWGTFQFHALWEEYNKQGKLPPGPEEEG